MVACEQDTHAAHAHEDTEDLSPMVADFEEEERNDDDDHNSPEVDQLG